MIILLRAGGFLALIISVDYFYNAFLLSELNGLESRYNALFIRAIVSGFIGVNAFLQASRMVRDAREEICAMNSASEKEQKQFLAHKAVRNFAILDSTYPEGSVYEYRAIKFVVVDRLEGRTQFHLYKKSGADPKGSMLNH